MLLFYVTVCLSIYTVHGLQCSSCSNECSEGYMSCSTCACAPTCDDIKCDSPRECIYETFPCTSGPCPKIPSCVDLTTLCQGSLLRHHDNPILCDATTLTCPREYLCTDVPGHSVSVCCKETTEEDTQPPIPQSKPFFPPLDLGPPYKEDKTDEDCGNCEMEPCDYLICDAYPNAQCVTDDCSCESWFIDQEANLLLCHEEPGEIPPGISKLFNAHSPTTTTKPPHSPSTPSLDIPKATPQPTGRISESPKNLKTHNVDTTDTSAVVADIITQVLIASCVVFAFVLVLLVSYKIYINRKKQRRHRADEQLKPLKDANGNKPEIA